MSKYEDAQDALFDAIKKTTDEVMAASGNPVARARALETIALAFRYTAGGAQPGSVVVDK